MTQPQSRRLPASADGSPPSDPGRHESAAPLRQSGTGRDALMLRLIGLVVVVLLVLSLAHGERTGAAVNRADSLADAVTGRLADGVRTLGDMVFGRADPDVPDSLRALGRNLDAVSRTADGASRRALAGIVLRSCPSLGLVCQPADAPPEGTPDPRDRRRPLSEAR